MRTVLQVIDEYVGEPDTSQVLALPPVRKQELARRLRHFYSRWHAPPHIGGLTRVYPGSWASSELFAQGKDDVISNDLLLFGQVVVRDPLEQFVSKHTRYSAPGLPEAGADQLTLFAIHHPPATSGIPSELATALYPGSTNTSPNFPPAAVFLPMPEVIDPVEDDWTRRATTALEALEMWRPFIERGFLVLVPVYEISLRKTKWLAELGDGRAPEVLGFLSDSDPEFAPITSAFTSGLEARANWLPSEVNAARSARHVAWVYAREAVLCAETGALYSPDESEDASLLRMLGAGTPFAADHLSRSATLQFPGFANLNLDETLAIMDDSDAFAELRNHLNRIVLDAPFDLSDDSPSAQELLAEHLDSRISALRREVSARESRGFGQLVVRVSLGVMGGLTAGLEPAIGTVAAGLFSTWASNLGSTPSERAVAWMSRSLSGRSRRPRT